MADPPVRLYADPFPSIKPRRADRFAPHFDRFRDLTHRQALSLPYPQPMSFNQEELASIILLAGMGGGAEQGPVHPRQA